jgi:hypothetical protein
MGVTKLLFSVCFLFVSSCTLSQNIIKKVQLKYVSFEMETDIHVTCNDFESSFKDQIKIIDITDKYLLGRLTHYLKEAQIDKKVYRPDVRTKIYIYNIDGSVDVLCVGKFALELNGKSLIANKDFVNFIKKLEYSHKSQ